MCTQAELDDYCRRTCTELQGMRDEHDKGKKRRVKHLEVKNHLKNDNKPAPTRRRGIGAIRLTRRQRNLEVIEQYEERETHAPEVVELFNSALDLENEAILAELERRTVSDMDEIRLIALEEAGNVVLDTADLVDTFGDTLHLTSERYDQLVLR